MRHKDKKKNEIIMKEVLKKRTPVLSAGGATLHRYLLVRRNKERKASGFFRVNPFAIFHDVWAK